MSNLFGSKPPLVHTPPASATHAQKSASWEDEASGIISMAIAPMQKAAVFASLRATAGFIPLVVMRWSTSIPAAGPVHDMAR